MTALGMWPRNRLGLSPRRRRPTSPPPPFAPDQLADLAFWWKAGDPQNTVTSGAVEQAFDLSGHGRHGTQSTGTMRPLDTVDPDGRPIMRFDGVDDVLQQTSPPNLLGGVTVFVAYRIRQHVDGGGIIAAGITAGGAGSAQFFEFHSQSSLNRTALSAKTAQVDPIQTANRIDPTDRTYAIFAIDDDSAALRDFLGSATDSSSSIALGTPEVIALGARVLDQLPTTPFGFIDVYEVGLYARALSTGEIDQLEDYVKVSHAIGWSPGYLDSDLAWWHDDWSGFTLSGSLVDQWSDRSSAGRHWTASGAARPAKTTDAGNVVVRFDGTDDALELGATMPPLEPFTVAVVYRMRNRVDFEGVLSAAAASGVDHESFWTFENATAASNNMQLFGRSLEANQLALTRADGGVAQVAIWTADAGTATLRDRTGAVSDTYGGSFGTPAAIVLGARYNAGSLNHAEVDVMATVGVTSVLSAGDQQQLIDWSTAKWGV